jgi:hypothetical protein
MYFKTPPVPSAHSELFHGGIDHPELWLWDSWTLQEISGSLHLYCLALSRRDSDGAAILPPDRNDYTFHVRHFTSADDGRSWRDKGAIGKPGGVTDGADARNVWSGSALNLEDGRIAHGFTGVRDRGPDRGYLQTICVAIAPAPDAPWTAPDAAVSCPERDYDAITAKGFYLGPKDQLGSNSGEDGGPILAWRDPYLFTTPDGELHAVWSAKIAPAVPAIAHARLAVDGDRIVLADLSAPIELPDASLMTQSEVPKVYRDAASGDYLLLVSACDRQYEGQPTRDCSHIHRLYRSPRLTGPWHTFRPGDSTLPGVDGLFGASLVHHDAAAGRFTLLGPYTENAGPDRQLRFAAPVDIRI